MYTSKLDGLCNTIMNHEWLHMLFPIPLIYHYTLDVTGYHN